MTASPTPFAEGSGEMPGSEPGKATHAKIASVQPASAAMPSEGDVARAAYAAMCEGYNSTPRWIDEPAEIKALYRAQARAVLALFAPILAEKEARIREMAMQALADDQQLTVSLDRALAAEAALAAERERFEAMVRAYEARSLEDERSRLEAAAPLSARETARYLEIDQKLAGLNAAAIRAQGE